MENYRVVFTLRERRGDAMVGEGVAGVSSSKRRGPGPSEASLSKAL
jgi:hypothetical protein